MEMHSFFKKLFAISFALFTLNNTLQAQDQIPDFVSIVEGSKNPEAVPNDAVYSSLANFIISTNPPNCISGNSEPTVTTQAHCAAPLPGIDMRKAVQLANEYQERKRINNNLIPDDFCDDASSYDFSRKSTVDFAADLDNAFSAISDANSTYFEKRANELLGNTGYEALKKYADNSIRPNITVSVIDYRLMMEKGGITPAIMVDRMCKGKSQQ